MTVIYFVASKGDEEHTKICEQIVQYLGRYGKVETEHLRKLDVLVAEVTNPSTRVGFDIGKVIEGNNWLSQHDQRRILCLYRSPDKEFFQRLSRLGDPVLVNSGFNLEEYSSTEEARKSIDDFFKNRTPRNQRNTFPLI